MGCTTGGGASGTRVGGLIVINGVGCTLVSKAGFAPAARDTTGATGAGASVATAAAGRHAGAETGAVNESAARRAWTEVVR